MRIPNSATGELEVNDRLVFTFEQVQQDELSELETAAIVTMLRSYADAIETEKLDTPAQEILEDTSHTFDLFDDEPSNVE